MIGAFLGDIWQFAGGGALALIGISLIKPGSFSTVWRIALCYGIWIVCWLLVAKSIVPFVSGYFEQPTPPFTVIAINGLIAFISWLPALAVLRLMPAVQVPLRHLPLMASVVWAATLLGPQLRPSGDWTQLSISMAVIIAGLACLLPIAFRHDPYFSGSP